MADLLLRKVTANSFSISLRTRDGEIIAKVSVPAPRVKSTAADKTQKETALGKVKRLAAALDAAILETADDA